jgi:hypothetical protein
MANAPTLSAGPIAGIAIAGVAVGAGACFIILWLVERREKAHDALGQSFALEQMDIPPTPI